jgi:hypothetical protein
MLRRPGLARDMGLEHIPGLASSDQIVNDLLAMAWYSVSLTGSSLRLLTSDRPCVYTTGLQNRDECVIALPISPEHAFIAFYPESKAERGLKALSQKELAGAINQSVVSQAGERAYCQRSADAPDTFFRKWLKPGPS